VGFYLPSTYGCAHRKMGPSGHQGIVSVVVNDGAWACAASIRGTNLSTQSVSGGDPECFELKRSPAKLHAGLVGLDRKLDSLIAESKDTKAKTSDLQADLSHATSGFCRQPKGARIRAAERRDSARARGQEARS
jgi:hypothetical protein